MKGREVTVSHRKLQMTIKDMITPILAPHRRGDVLQASGGERRET